MAGIAPQIALGALRFTGSGLKRPECVLATARGALYTADWRGGVAETLPDGSQNLFAASLPDGRPLRPNGIALRPDGSFLLADLGETQGGLFPFAARRHRSRPSSNRSMVLPCPPSNSPCSRGWQAHRLTGQHPPPANAASWLIAATSPTSFVAVIDGRSAKIVADGLCYTNLRWRPVPMASGSSSTKPSPAASPPSISPTAAACSTSGRSPSSAPGPSRTA